MLRDFDGNPLTREEASGGADSYTRQRVCRYTIASAGCGGAGELIQRMAQSSKSCEVILSTDN